MPLRQVQAAITRAIHEDLDEGAARRLFESFPDLSQAERQDLLAIPFERLEPYQFDIYSYEIGLMDWGFEMLRKTVSATVRELCAAPVPFRSPLTAAALESAMDKNTVHIFRQVYIHGERY